jgi:BASS family bile acid:Na+ symporter
MEAIDSVKINFNPEQLFWLNLCLGFLMFGVALDLKVGNFRYVLKNPRASLLGLASQLLLLPLLTLVLIWIWQPPPSVALGMILVAACPGGNVSNYAVHLAGANSALSISLTTVTTLFAAVITPVSFELFSQWIPGGRGLREVISLEFGSMLRIFFTLILLPLALGMSLNRWLPKLTKQLRRPVRWLSMAIFIGFVIAALFANGEVISEYLGLVFTLVLVHNALALTTGYTAANLAGLSLRDTRAVAIETGIQNSGLGLILIFNFFDGLGGMAMIAAWWGVWHLISAFTVAMWWRSRPAEALSAGA